MDSSAGAFGNVFDNTPSVSTSGTPFATMVNGGMARAGQQQQAVPSPLQSGFSPHSMQMQPATTLGTSSRFLIIFLHVVMIFESSQAETWLASSRCFNPTVTRRQMPCQTPTTRASCRNCCSIRACPVRRNRHRARLHWTGYLVV